MRTSLFLLAAALLFQMVPAHAAEPFISEFVPDNARTLVDEDEQFPDWLEIQNPNAAPIDLAGYFLTDDPAYLVKWMFPPVTIPARGALIVFASGKNRTNDPARLHTNFRLNTDGGFLALVRPDGSTVVSYFNYPNVDEDVAFGIVQNEVTESLLAGVAPQILVPASAGDLPAEWNQLAYAPGPGWLTGTAPAGIGFDTNTPSGAPVNVAPGGTAVQSTTLSSFTANLGIDGNFGNFTHTTAADTAPFWQLTLTNRMGIHSITLHNRTSCCGSRLRDITVAVLSTNETGTVTNYLSALLNPENSGFAYPNGPGSLTLDLVALTGGPVFGQFVRVSRTPDPDLSGTGGQGNNDEAGVLSLGEVTVLATGGSDYGPFIRTDLAAAMLGKNASAFVRLPFVSGDLSQADLLRLRVRYDDGFVAYLNGVEVARRNAPATLAWNSAATANRTAGEAVVAEEIDLMSALPLLTAGTNLLAIQVLNATANDGDLLLQPELIAVRQEVRTNVFLADPTPGERNAVEWYFAEVEDTRFSVDRGFFEAPFSLAITSGTPDAVIYYSFNADEPGPGKGIIYTGPITITNTTVVRARAFKENWKPTSVDTHTYLFLTDVIHQAANWPQTRVPPPNFPATWGANAVDYGMDPNVVTNYTLEEWKEALTQIPTMSVVTEMPNLFDQTTGIYANALQQGELWERPASLELLDPADAVPGRFQENCGLRIRGGFSRNPQFVKHAFRVFFRREYGAGKLNYPLFEDEGANEFDKIDLRTSSNYAWSRESSSQNGTNDTNVREVWCRETLGAMGQPYRRSRYYHLYLNGQYWGLYETDERPEASYGATYFGGDREDFDTVKCGNRGTDPDFITEATDGNLIAFSNLWTMCRAHAANPTASNYFRILGRNPDGTRNPSLPVMLEVENLIDYMLGIFFSGDGDATLSAFLANNQPNNWFGMRDRTNPDVGFRFFNSDCEHTLGAPSSQVDRTGPFRDVAGSNIGNFLYANPQYLHEDLMWNPEYRQLFADRVQKHFFNGGALTFEQCTNRWWRKANQITRAIRANSARWGDAVREPPYGERDWTNIINWVANVWFPPRANIVLAQLRADGLVATIGAPSFGQFGGAVPAGYALNLNHTNSSGVIYYTLDGADPRTVGGDVSASAQAYSGPIPIHAQTHVRARVLIDGTWSAIVEQVFFPPQDLSRLLITELMYHPAEEGLIDGDDFEFIELKNAGTNALNLSGLRFTSGITYTFPAGSLLAPGEFIVLVRDAARFASRYPGVPVHGTYSGGLNNTGEEITLSHALGTTLLSFTYVDVAPWPVTPDGFGFSLVRQEAGENPDPDDPTYWRASTFVGGSPGADDPPSMVSPVLISEVLSHTETGLDAVELFNPSTAPVEIGGWFLSDDPGQPRKFRIPPGTTIPPVGYLLFDETDFNPTPGTNNSFAFSSAGDDVYIFSGDAETNLTGFSHGFEFAAAPDGATFGRYLISTGEEHFPEQTAPTLGQPNLGPRVGPVVITEIHYNPAAGGDEFVELKNITDTVVRLYDLAQPDNRWKVAGLDYTFPPDRVVHPNEIIILAATDPATFRARHGYSAQVFGPYPGTLQNSGERLELQRPDTGGTNGVAYITVDAVRYNDRAPWPAAADGGGASLQRKNPLAYGNDPANWEAAVPTPATNFIGGQVPVILAQPQSQSVISGQRVVFSVVADGPAPLIFQWRFNGDSIVGATGSDLVLESVRASDAGNYSVVVFNRAGSAASAIAHLTVQQAPTITLQPTNQFVPPDTTATFRVIATGSGVLRYQWQRDGVDLPDETNSTLVVSNAAFADEGLYRVVITDDVGPVTSEEVRLLILVAPFFVEQPLSQMVVAGGTVTLSATVTNSATLPIGYRLRRNSIILQDSLVSLNERTVFFTLTNLQPEHTRYQIIVTNAARLSGLLSAIATLTFVADTDGDGLPDPWEEQFGLNTINAADANVDSDGDGMLNGQEFIAGTEPTNALSYLKIDALETSAGATIRFGAVSNRTYTVQFTESLGGVWTRLANVAASPTNRMIEVSDPGYSTNRFYRLAVPRAE